MSVTSTSKTSSVPRRYFILARGAVPSPSFKSAMSALACADAHKTTWMQDVSCESEWLHTRPDLCVFCANHCFAIETTTNEPTLPDSILSTVHLMTTCHINNMQTLSSISVCIYACDRTMQTALHKNHTMIELTSARAAHFSVRVSARFEFSTSSSMILARATWCKINVWVVV